jgi:hypothetical protein
MLRMLRAPPSSALGADERHGPNERETHALAPRPPRHGEEEAESLGTTAVHHGTS